MAPVELPAAPFFGLEGPINSLKGGCCIVDYVGECYRGYYGGYYEFRPWYM